MVCIDVAPCSNALVDTTVLTDYRAKIDWFGTARARLGFLVNDQLLVYGTGGLAYGKVALSGNVNVSAACRPQLPLRQSAILSEAIQH